MSSLLTVRNHICSALIRADCYSAWCRSLRRRLDNFPPALHTRKPSSRRLEDRLHHRHDRGRVPSPRRVWAIRDLCGKGALPQEQIPNRPLGHCCLSHRHDIPDQLLLLEQLLHLFPAGGMQPDCRRGRIRTYPLSAHSSQSLYTSANTLPRSTQPSK